MTAPAQCPNAGAVAYPDPMTSLGIFEFVCADCAKGEHCRRYDTWCDCGCRDTPASPRPGRPAA